MFGIQQIALSILSVREEPAIADRDDVDSPLDRVGFPDQVPGRGIQAEDAVDVTFHGVVAAQVKSSSIDGRRTPRMHRVVEC